LTEGASDKLFLRKKHRLLKGMVLTTILYAETMKGAMTKSYMQVVFYNF
jgi:hypothetical protein